MSSNGHTRVLVVEDDHAVRATLVDMLELNNYAVEIARDGSEGLSKARATTPDVILTDISMPGLNGFEFLAALRADEETRATPVIIISASAEPERMRQGMDLGAEDFMVKPFTEEQVLASIRARLEKKALLDELDAFAHTVAHDLKNPIGVLLGRVGLMRMLWEKADDATLLNQVAALEESAVRLNNIVEELLLLAGVRRQSVQPVPVDMAAVVRESLGRVEHLVAKSGAQVEQPRDWPVALGYPPWIAEVMTNYLSNAIKYGGQPPLITLGGELVAERKMVRYWVSDNGAGLSAEQQSKLFQQFSRIAGTRAKGHGLGLSIVRRITEKLHGAAGVESSPGRGSRFWFELPSAG